MRRFILRIKGGHRDPGVEAEAQRDLQQAMREEIEALRLEKAQALKRAADAERKLIESGQREAHLKFRLALALVTDFMHTALRQRASAAQLERTRVLPRRALDLPNRVRNPGGTDER